MCSLSAYRETASFHMSCAIADCKITRSMVNRKFHPDCRNFQISHHTVRCHIQKCSITISIFVIRHWVILFQKHHIIRSCLCDYFLFLLDIQLLHGPFISIYHPALPTGIPDLSDFWIEHDRDSRKKDSCPYKKEKSSPSFRLIHYHTIRFRLFVFNRTTPATIAISTPLTVKIISPVPPVPGRSFPDLFTTTFTFAAKSAFV